MASHLAPLAPTEELDPWLFTLRERITRSPEFRVLSAQLFGAVRASLRADEGLPFGELSAMEQRVVVSRAKQLLLDSDAYAACRDEAWRTLDSALDAEAEERIVKQHRGAVVPGGGSKASAVLDLAGAGATQLLGRWPQEQGSLLWMLNSALPPPLRIAVWRLRLRAPGARGAFTAKQKESPLAVVSLRDGAILQQAHLAVQRAHPEMLPELTRIKACLSYADSLGALTQQPATKGKDGAPGDTPPPPPEFYWALALARVFTTAEGGESELVERYISLLSMPKPLLNLPAPPGAASQRPDPVATAVAAAVGVRATGDAMSASAHLKAQDADLASHLEARLGGAANFNDLLLPYAQRLGVGLLSYQGAGIAWHTSRPVPCPAPLCPQTLTRPSLDHRRRLRLGHVPHHRLVGAHAADRRRDARVSARRAAQLRGRQGRAGLRIGARAGAHGGAAAACARERLHGVDPRDGRRRRRERVPGARADELTAGQFVCCVACEDRSCRTAGRARSQSQVAGSPHAPDADLRHVERAHDRLMTR